MDAQKLNMAGRKQINSGEIIMGRWLIKLESMPDRHLTEPTEPTSVSFVGAISSDSAEISSDNLQKISYLRELIVKLKQIYNGSESEWLEYANDVILEWSHDLDEAIQCFELLNTQNDLSLKIA